MREIRFRILRQFQPFLFHVHTLLQRLCKLCGREFQRKESLIAHIRVNHRVQEVKGSNGSVEKTKGATHDRSQKGGKVKIYLHLTSVSE